MLSWRFVITEGPIDGFCLQNQDEVWHFTLRTTSHQVFKISSEVVGYAKSGSVLDAAVWAELVKKYCPSAGQWAYRGLDNSDIRTLLAMAIQVTEGRGQ